MPKFTVDDVLAKLDHMAQSGLWPRFDDGLGTFEYHAMRLVAVLERGGDEDWGIAFEVVAGDFHDEESEHPHGAGISTYVITPLDPYGTRDWRQLPLSITPDRDSSKLSIEGITLQGPAGELLCHDAMLEAWDLRPGMLCGGCDGGAEDSNLIVLIRAYLEKYPGSLWGDVSAAFGAPCDVVARFLRATLRVCTTLRHPWLRVLLTCDAFEHVPDPRSEPEVLPSASLTYRSLAEALVHRDASRFVAGASNLDWRRWATMPDDAVDELDPCRFRGPSHV